MGVIFINLPISYLMDLSTNSSSNAIIEDPWAAEFGEYLPLCRAIQTGDWETAQEFYSKDKDAFTRVLCIVGYRALHYAIGNPENILLVENLLEKISPELLPELVNKDVLNPLHYAAILDNRPAAEVLVEKNPYLLFTVDKRQYTPVLIAVINSHINTFCYLLEKSKQHVALISQINEGSNYSNPFEGEQGVLLVGQTILAGFLDVAYGLLKEYPELATKKSDKFQSPLWCLAKMWNIYPSAERYNFYQRCVYSRMLLLHLLLYMMPHIKHLHEDKVKHNLARKLLNFTCEEIVKLKSGDQFKNYADAFHVAVLDNIPEVVDKIATTFPQAVWVYGAKGHHFAQLTIVNRSENIYNFFVHKMTYDKHIHTVSTDNEGNNLLHLAGKLAPAHKLNKVTGAALRMQRELQWYKEVEKIMRPKAKEAVNNEGETPMMVFRKEHKDLRQEGEEWMKKTADSYTITAALIITIVFAAAITVPGGNNGDTGKPIYKTSPSFIIFAISDAISLFTSTTSLLLFLSILTARFAEDDFLYKLPKRLVLGLVMLFMSVTAMMIAFSATLYIMFGLDNSWVLIPIALLTCLPIASFVTLQLPLLVDLIDSTYGPGIFLKGSEHRITS
ncbi:hypothetical protein SSX86_025465 [Deinandra increscens subsp. villosa]|uniref:PGG domain-containing protein n=1 Tax=Deinandra increscens subsp. villosa TaxID=3103831 RepID=A0AAP0GN06_9ASTR